MISCNAVMGLRSVEFSSLLRKEMFSAQEIFGKEFCGKNWKFLVTKLKSSSLRPNNGTTTTSKFVSGVELGSSTILGQEVSLLCVFCNKYGPPQAKNF